MTNDIILIPLVEMLMVPIGVMILKFFCYHNGKFVEKKGKNGGNNPLSLSYLGGLIIQKLVNLHSIGAY
jgi:hypothetical protein